MEDTKQPNAQLIIKKACLYQCNGPGLCIVKFKYVRQKYDNDKQNERK